MQYRWVLLKFTDVSVESHAFIISADDGAGFSFETSVNFYRTARCYILDDDNRREKKFSRE